jgi:hypothetical protein
MKQNKYPQFVVPSILACLPKNIFWPNDTFLQNLCLYRLHGIIF